MRSINADGSREIIFVTFHQRLMSRDMSGRFEPIYAALTEPGTPGPAGLDMRPFKPTAGYLDEVLAVGPQDGAGTRFVARCLTGPLAAEIARALRTGRPSGRRPQRQLPLSRTSAAGVAAARFSTRRAVGGDASIGE